MKSLNAIYFFIFLFFLVITSVPQVKAESFHNYLSPIVLIDYPNICPTGFFVYGLNKDGTLKCAILSGVNVSYNISYFSTYFVGFNTTSGGYLYNDTPNDLTFNESKLNNTIWIIADNGTLYHSSNPYGFYNSTTLPAELEPLWNGNYSTFLTHVSLTQLLSFNYWNSTFYGGIGNWSADKPDYLTIVGLDNATIIRSWNTTWIITNVGNWSNDKINYLTIVDLDNGTIIRSFNGSWIVSQVGNFSAWNKSYNDLIDKPTNLSQFIDDLGNRGYTSLSNFTNDLNIGNWTQDQVNYFTKLDILGFNYYNSTNPQNASGSNTYVQFNDNGAFNGTSDLVFNKTLKGVGIGGTPTHSLDVYTTANTGASFKRTGQGELDFSNLVASNSLRSFIFGAGAYKDFTFEVSGTIPFILKNVTARWGLGTSSPNAQAEILSNTTEQLRLSYNSTSFTSFTIDSSGNLKINGTSGNVNVSNNLTALNFFGNLIGTWNGSSLYYLNSNPFNFWNNSYATFNKTYADTLYYGINNPFSYYNSTTLPAELEPLWNGNYSNVVLAGGKSNTQTINGGNATGGVLTLNSNPANDSGIMLGGNILYPYSTNMMDLGSYKNAFVGLYITGLIHMQDIGGANNWTILSAGTPKANVTYILPDSAPTSNGQVLTSTTVGAMSWSSVSTPSGMISAFYLAICPTGWVMANGTTYGGIGTPDLRDRFIIASGSTYAFNTTGGSTGYSPAGTIAWPVGTPSFTGTPGTTGQASAGNQAAGSLANTLTQKVHTHTFTPAGTIAWPLPGTPGGDVPLFSGTPVTIIMPYYSLIYCMKT